jgi:hypothetical protein
MPFTIEEYSKGLYYAEAYLQEEYSKEIPSEFIEEKEYEESEDLGKGYYTYKVFHIASKIPTFITYLFGEDNLNFHEKCYNSLESSKMMKTNTTVYL